LGSNEYSLKSNHEYSLLRSNDYAHDYYTNNALTSPQRLGQGVGVSNRRTPQNAADATPTGDTTTLRKVEENSCATAVRHYTLANSIITHAQQRLRVRHYNLLFGGALAKASASFWPTNHSS